MIVNLAERAHNHNWQLDPIIRSVLDTDFYKLLMLQFIWKHFSSVDVTFSLANRTKPVVLADHISLEELRMQLDHVRSLRVHKSELIWLAGNTFYGKRGIFEPEFLEWLEHDFRLPEYELSIVDGEISLNFSGPWTQTTLWEVYALAIVSELKTRAGLRAKSEFALDILYARAKATLWNKIEKLRGVPGLRVADFGTRRRHSFLWQEYVVKAMRDTLGASFTGTSNTYLAYKHDLEAIGTNAHELPMALAAIATNDEELQSAQYRVLELWQNTYQRELLIALPDTFGTTQFLASAPDWVADWTGQRMDSKSPYVGGDEYIAWLRKRGRDPEKKLIIASDGLDVQDILGLHAYFAGEILNGLTPETFQSAADFNDPLKWNPKPAIRTGRAHRELEIHLRGHPRSHSGHDSPIVAAWAIRANSATPSASPRAPGSTPAARRIRSASGADPAQPARAARSVLRRCENAASTTANTSARGTSTAGGPPGEGDQPGIHVGHRPEHRARHRPGPAGVRVPGQLHRRHPVDPAPGRSGHPVGHLRLHHDQWFQDSVAQRRAAESEFRWIAFAVPCVMLLMLLASGVVVLRRVLLPMQRLDQAAAAIRRGDMTFRLDNTTQDEFGDLSREFDAMTAALIDSDQQRDRSEQQLRDITDNLPALVGYIDPEHRVPLRQREVPRVAGPRPVQHGRPPRGRGAGRGRLRRDEGPPRQGAGRRARAVGAQRAPRRRRAPPAGRIHPRHRARTACVRGCYTLTVDITERRAAELEIARSEQRMADLTNAIPAMVGYFDMDETCLYANDAGLRSLGVDRADIPGITHARRARRDGLRAARALRARGAAGPPRAPRGQGGIRRPRGALPGAPDPRPQRRRRAARLLPDDLRHHRAEGGRGAAREGRGPAARDHRQPAGGHHLPRRPSSATASSTAPAWSGCAVRPTR